MYFKMRIYFFTQYVYFHLSIIEHFLYLCQKKKKVIYNVY